MTGMSFFGLFVIILILMVVGWALIILAIPLTIYLFISTSDDWKQLFITILGALKIYR